MSRLFTIALLPVFVLWASLAVVSAQSKMKIPVPPMPGRLVATDAGHRLHLWCTGEGSPTVLLLNGGGAFSIDWAVIQPAVAAKTRVCSYDRAGYAWSDPGPAPRGVSTSVAELHQVLARADVRPPYVLVGSSWGGLIARMFAHAHSDEVVGVVLADATPWGIEGVTPLTVADDVLMNLDPRAEEEPAPVGKLPADVLVARAWATSRLPKPDPTIPPVTRNSRGEIVEVVQGFMSLEFSDFKEPNLAIDATIAGNRVPLGDTPLTVISAGRVSWDAPTRAGFRSYADAQRAHIAEQARLAGLSRNSTLVVGRASFHAVQFYEPEVITDAILQLLALARLRAGQTTR